MVICGIIASRDRLTATYIPWKHCDHKPPRYCKHTFKPYRHCACKHAQVWSTFIPVLTWSTTTGPTTNSISYPTAHTVYRRTNSIVCTGCRSSPHGAWDIRWHGSSQRCVLDLCTYLTLRTSTGLSVAALISWQAQWFV